VYRDHRLFKESRSDTKAHYKSDIDLHESEDKPIVDEEKKTIFLSIEDQVDVLIDEATDIRRLAKMWVGWNAWV